MINNNSKIKFVNKSKNLASNAWKILIVDDEDGVHTITKTVLSGFTFEGDALHFISAYSALEAQKVMMNNDDIALILLDVVMEEDDSGLKFVQFVRENIKNDMVRIVLRTGQPGRAPERDVIIKYDINDYKEKTELTSDKLFTTIIASIRNYRDLKTIKSHKTVLENLNQEVTETQAEILYTLGEVMENRSKETASHVKRVAKYTYLLATKYGLDEKEAFTLKSASPLHDIGKIGIEDSILLKPGKLTEEEFIIMKTHATIGYDILKTSTRSILRAAAIVAHEHHEKYDGNGYPNAKKGTDIHIYGRMVAIADVFDALTHKRVYKKAWSFDKAITYLIDEKSKHFDPTLIDIFVNNLDEVKEIYSIE